MVRNSQNETSFQPINSVNDLNKVKNVLLRDSATRKPKFGLNYDQTLTSNEQEKYSPEMKKQRKYQTGKNLPHF